MDQQAVKRLIEQSTLGDKTSFRRLVESHQPFAYAAAFRIVCNDYEAEEIVQDAFIRVWKHLANFDNEMRFSTWLYKIVVNLCYDRLKATRTRRKHMENNMDNNVLMNTSSSENIEKQLINREQAQIIRYLTQMLTPKQKVVFILSELEELSVDEIIAITGLTAAKIKSNLYCARREIKDKLSAMEERRGRYAI